MATLPCLSRCRGHEKCSRSSWPLGPSLHAPGRWGPHLIPPQAPPFSYQEKGGSYRSTPSPVLSTPSPEDRGRGQGGGGLTPAADAAFFQGGPQAAVARARVVSL